MSSTTIENPCLACSVHQDCCTRLTGLTLTLAEYERCFAHHGDAVEVERDGPLVIINASSPAPCPNWRSEGCAVYRDRPAECRLFPHNSYVKHHTSERVSVRFHEVHTCPMVHELKMAESEAEDLVKRFATEAFGETLKIDVSSESATESASRNLSALIAKLSRGWRKMTNRMKPQPFGSHGRP